ncbi:hypothetical protein HK097_009144 [Rhizophlyctis rosea]|uniref:Uncharacterized protein n=1 Tax=Rhizophlyctis rosea TaxID=64517 RepID=A0AAD5S9D4_9FUNG|nr:hypothetical protein HK097_009144 [Rhizophlyctis rosea]
MTNTLPKKRPNDSSQSSTPAKKIQISADRNLFSTSPSTTSPKSISTPDAATSTPTPSKPKLTQEDIFKRFRLRRVVRENHGRDVNHCVFFVKPGEQNSSAHQEESLAIGDGEVPATVDGSNVLATVGGAQANFYDNEHCGDHLDIMSHFVVGGEGYNGRPVSADPYELLTCCWLTMPNDAVLAASGTDNIIHILSIAQSKEQKPLSGHTGPIIDIASHPTDTNLLFSLSKDGSVRLWHVGAGRTLVVYDVKATALALHPYGTSFLTANTNGSVHDWDVPEDILNLPTEEAESVEVEHVTEGVKVATASRLHGGSYVDSIRYIGDKVLSKSRDGKVLLWDPESSQVTKLVMPLEQDGDEQDADNGIQQVIQKFTIKGGDDNRCRFDVTPDKKYFAIGNESGTVFIYNLSTGKLVTELRHKRCTKAVRCCAFSRNCRNLVFVGEDSFIWRFDYISDETLEKWKSSEQ